MAVNPSQFGLIRLLLRASKVNRRGFTLIELLIAMLVGSIIVGSLLYLVVELLQTNRREEVLTQTQQDMQRAIDYITRDAREAVFVYSTPSVITGQLNDLPTGATPILAFWRLSPVEPKNDFWKDVPSCSTTFTGTTELAKAKRAECDTLKLRQSFYTLVVYLQQVNGDGTLWAGPSRIIRYELPKYSASDIKTLTPRQGYWDPTAEGNSFATWQRASTAITGQNLNPGNTQGSIQVLTDYVDEISQVTPTCPTSYILSPAKSDSFYACVSNEAVVTGAGTRPAGVNQSLLVFLRGNATENRPGLISTYSESGRTPTLEAEILIRGLIDKAGS